MKTLLFLTNSFLLLPMILCAVTICSAQDNQNTEISGFYQQYRDFSYKLSGTATSYDVPATTLKGGGFIFAQNLAPWFAFWSQTSIFGSVGQTSALSIRAINNLEGARWQTKQHGPFRLYVKGGLGFSHFTLGGAVDGSDTKLSLAYGGGAQAWFSRSVGLFGDLSHILMGLPNLTDADGRDKWDSGLTLTTGLAIRF
jgi:hypothetical protein